MHHKSDRLNLNRQKTNTFILMNLYSFDKYKLTRITKMHYGPFYAYYFCLVNCTTKRNLAGLTPVCMGGDLWP